MDRPSRGRPSSSEGVRMSVWSKLTPAGISLSQLCAAGGVVAVSVAVASAAFLTWAMDDRTHVATLPVSTEPSTPVRSAAITAPPEPLVVAPVPSPIGDPLRLRPEPVRHARLPALLPPPSLQPPLLHPPLLHAAVRRVATPRVPSVQHPRPAIRPALRQAHWYGAPSGPPPAPGYAWGPDEPAYYAYGTGPRAWRGGPVPLPY